MKKHTRKLAEDFIEGQLKIMAKYGDTSKVSKKRIAQAVGHAEKSFISLTCDTPDKFDLR